MRCPVMWEGMSSLSPPDQPAWAPEGRVPPPPVGEAAPGGWGRPAPGYAEPGYRPVDGGAYPPTTAWGAGAEGGYQPAPVRRRAPGWASTAPALLASLMISVGVIVLFFGNLFIALGAPRGTSGRDRLLQFLAAGDLGAAAALVLAVALVVWQRSRPEGASVAGPRGGRLRTVALLAGAVAGVVALAALLRGFVLLTVPHTPGAVKVGDLIAHLGIVIIAGAAAWWSARTRW